MNVDEAWELYEVQLRADGRSEHTIRQHAWHTRLLAGALAGREVADLTHADVARFLASRAATHMPSGEPRLASTVNALRSGVRSFFGFVHAAGYAPSNAARLVRRARCSPPPPRALSDAERERLVAALDQGRSVAELRDRALFRLLLGAGLRVGSALALDVEDLDLEARVVRMRTMKNADQDVAFVPADVVEILREHVGERRTGPVFEGVGGRRIGARQVHRRLAEWAGRAGIARAVSPHHLRHTFATRVYQRTGDLLVTARALGHRSVGSTMVYARGDARAVRVAVDATSITSARA